MSKKLTLLFMLLLLFLSSCNNKFDIEENNSIFFEKYQEMYDDNISLDKLSIYYYESYFYYDVEGSDSETDYHFLYVYRYHQFQIWYSIKYPEIDKDFYPNSYEHYLLAKEKGESKIYSQEEIMSFITEYYDGIELRGLVAIS